MSYCDDEMCNDKEHMECSRRVFLEDCRDDYMRQLEDAISENKNLLIALEGWREQYRALEERNKKLLALKTTLTTTIWNLWDEVEK